MASTSNTNGAIETPVSYEELIQLENEFDDVDNEIIRRQYELSAPLYKRRKNLAAQIPNFWPLVFEEAPGDIDRYIQPSDSQLFADCFKSFEVERFELDSQPRSFLLRFEFSPNKWFDDAILEKRFWMRRASDNWTGLISEPVKISWKEGMDLTHGITDAAVALWKAQQKVQSNGTASKDEQRKMKGLQEHDALVKKLDSSEMSMPSFFTLFGFVSSKRYVSAEESDKANSAETDRRKRREKGETIEDPEEEDISSDDADAMVCPYGDDLAYVLAEDVWPSAIKYFTAAQEQDDGLISDDEFQSEEVDEDSDSEEVDIRALVKGKAQKRKEKSNSDIESPPPRSRQRRGN